MVQILPRKTNVGSDIGQALGGGLQSGMGQGFQRGLLQNALKEVKNLSQQENTKPLDLMLGLMEAGAGIPGSERYLSTLLPMLLQNSRVNQLYGNNGEGTPNEGPPQATPQVSPSQAKRGAQQFAEGNKPAGYLALPMTPEQQEQYAETYAQIMNDPNAYDQGFSQAQNINSTRNQARQSIMSEADNLGILPEEKQRFMQYATEAQDSNDPTQIIRYATDKTLQLRNWKNSLQNVDAPGLYAKLGGLPGAVGGAATSIYSALTNKGAARRKALKGYENLVKDIVNEGEEPFARETLAKKGLSPSEVEELIHPLTDANVKNAGKLPRGNQLNPKARKDKLVDFFRHNVDNNTSLSVLRNYLVEDKNYSWEEVRDAIQSAFPNGNNLTKYQSAEMSNLAKPPKQSLSQIFGPQADLTGFLRGQR
jgi:hypothetical protein